PPLRADVPPAAPRACRGTQVPRAVRGVRPDVCAERDLGFVLVVAPTPERDVADRGRPVHRVGMDVVKLQEVPLRAPVSPGGNERTLPAIAPPYGAFDVDWNVT